MFELAVYNNLPSEIVINSCYVIPKATKVAVILIYTTDSITGIGQPLLATEMYGAEPESWHYHITIDQESKANKITFQSISPGDSKQMLKVNQ